MVLLKEWNKRVLLTFHNQKTNVDTHNPHESGSALKRGHA